MHNRFFWIIPVSTLFNAPALATDAPKLQNSFNVEIGAKYVYTKNTTILKTHHNQINGNAGETSAKLDWNSIYSHGVELSAKIVSQDTNFYSKGALLIDKSFNKSGEMRDTDFMSITRVSIADSTSIAELSKGLKLNINFGKDFYLDKTTISPFIGWYYAKDRMEAFGLTWLPVGDRTLYNTYNLSLGEFVPKTIRDMTYETIINAPRLGISIQHPLSERFSINVEPVFMPFARMRLNDWHHLTPDKVHDALPNLISKKVGVGYSADVALNYKFSEKTHVGVGINYSEFTMRNADTINRMVSGTNIMHDSIKNLRIQNLGLVSSFKYRF